MRAYMDADVLIAHLRGDKKAIEFIRNMRDGGEYELWIGAMQRAEIVFYMRPAETETIFAFLSQFRTASVDQEIVDDGAALFLQWHPSHGTDVNDALLAATARRTGGKIFTLNTKHYPMPDLLVTKAW